MVDKISLPVIIPDRLLISPGIWNDNKYTAKEIGEAFAKTKWEDKDKISLWLNHDDNNTAAFVGYVKNPILASQGRVFGDLEIWDEKTATILTQAMAKFGVSAKIKGEEDKKGKMQNFTFENFSVVTVPACSEAYINLSKKETKIVSKYLISNEIKTLSFNCECVKCGHKIKSEEHCSELKCPECGGQMRRAERPGPGKEELAKGTGSKVSDKSFSNTTERRLENMAEEEEKKEEVVEEKTEESKEPEEKELSEKDLLKSLCSKFDKLVALLSKKLEEEKPEEKEEKEESKEEEKPTEEVDKSTEEVEKENKELTEVKKELAEIKTKLNAPKSKTVRNLSSNTVGDTAKYSHEEFGSFLTGIDRPVKII